jgi:hypothetical protein
MQIDRCGRRCASPAYGEDHDRADERVVALAIVRCRAGARSKAIVRSGARRRLLLGDSASGQGPTGTDMLTSAFAESTRAPRRRLPSFPGPDHGRLLAVGCERLEEAVGRPKRALALWR